MASPKHFWTKEPGSSYNFTLHEMLQFQQAVFFFLVLLILYRASLMSAEMQ